MQRLQRTLILKWAQLTISSYVCTNFQLKRLKGTYSLQVTELLREHILTPEPKIILSQKTKK